MTAKYTVDPIGKPLAVMVSIATLEQLVEAFEAVEALIEHQYTGTREGMNALQNASDDAQAAITALRAALSNFQSGEVITKPKDFPAFPCHPEPRIMKWSELEIETIQTYAKQYAEALGRKAK